MAYLSQEFLSQYKDIQPKNAGMLFETVYLRTYAQYRPKENRRERWWETVQRVVEYSLSLYQGPAQYQDLVKEAELMYDKIFHLEVLPAGRTLWIGGMPAAQKFPECNFNCSFAVLDELEIFGDLFQLLLCGCGVGFRILPEDVEKLPRFTTDFKVIYKPYETLHGRAPQSYIYENTHVETETFDSKAYVRMTIGDSREGWVEALRQFLTHLTTNNSVEMTIDFNSIRPKGSRINGFGGKAPGAEGLMEMFQNLERIIRRSSGKLRPIDCLDIMNFIGKNVIVGGTRRSAEIALGSPQDQEFIEAKLGLWITRENLQRVMSNNSLVFEEKPSREYIDTIFKSIRTNGEPGFLNLEAAKKRRPTMAGSNPCNEILLDSRGFCNLTTVNLYAFVDKNTKQFDYRGAEAAIRLATRVGSRMTNVTISLPKWDYIQKRDRLLGVSMTGIMDSLDEMEIEFDSEEAVRLFKFMRWAAEDEANKYAFEMRIPRPLLVTTCKPEGTCSQLPTVSSGVHRSYAPYYIRRIRVSELDAVASALKKLGVPWERDAAKAERLVFSFPIKTDAKIKSEDEPAQRQFERYLTVMKEYVDHNCSITITADDSEWAGLAQSVYEHWNEVIGISCLPKATTAYPQLPYSAITKEQYDELMLTFPKDLNEKLPALVDKFEAGEIIEDELETDCAGACPLR